MAASIWGERENDVCLGEQRCGARCLPCVRIADNYKVGIAMRNDEMIETPI